MKVLIQIKVGKEYRKIDLGEDMNYIETTGLELVFINKYENSITYVVNKKDNITFEFGKNWYNIYINSPIRCKT